VAALRRAVLALSRIVPGPDDGGADGGQVGGPLPLGETAGTRAAQVAADARLEETGVLRRTIGAGHWLSLEPGVLSQATDWMDGACSTSSTST
jgi:hypothetical protein